MPKTPTNKSAFIRSLPPDMPAGDVVAKAKDANLKITPAFVYAIRSKSRNKGRAKAAPARRKGRARKAAGGKVSASDFVRSQPSSMKAADVVAAGAKQGLKFSTNLVYAVRSGAGRRGPARAAAAGSGAPDATFRRLALDLGIAKARHIIDDLERRLRELIGG